MRVPQLFPHCCSLHSAMPSMVGFHYVALPNKEVHRGSKHKCRCLIAQKQPAKREGHLFSEATQLRRALWRDGADVTDPVCSFEQSWGRQPLAGQLCSELTSPPFSSLSVKADCSDHIDTAAAALQTATDVLSSNWIDIRVGWVSLRF